VPPAPKKLIAARERPVVLHSAGVFVDGNGLCYCTDWSGAGRYIMEYTDGATGSGAGRRFRDRT
jgi:hypothetical protein